MISAASINPGKLDRRVALRWPLPARSESGESADTWVDGATVWAQWLPASSREFMAAKARHAETTGIFRIRHRSDVTAAWRLVHSGDLFKLAGDPIEIGRREYLDLPVAALDQSPGLGLNVRLLHGDDAGALRLLHDGTPVLLHDAA